MKNFTASDRSPVFVATLGDGLCWPMTRSRRTNGRLWVTTDYVLDEMITRLFANRPFAKAEAFCAGVFESQKTGSLRLERITQQHFENAYRLRSRYRDKPRISFTDLTSFTVMRELKIRHVLTADTHFTQANLGFQIVP